MEEETPMTLQEYEYFDRRVETRMKQAKGGWFSAGFDQMVTVCEGKVSAGILEQRFNERTNRLEWRAL